MIKRAFRAPRGAVAKAALCLLLSVGVSACMGVAGPGSGAGGRDDEALGVAAVEPTRVTALALDGVSPADARRKGVACAGVVGSVCAVGQRCCRAPGTGEAQCVAPGAACADARAKDFECASSAECSTGSVCCARGALSAVGAAVTVHHFHGTHCATQCGAGEVLSCAANADCGGGSCAAAIACGMAIGACR